MANTKSTVRTQIESLLDELHHLIESMLGDYSEESLVMRNSKGITRFFKKEKNGTYTYLSASNNKEISQFAQKRYLRELKKVAKREIAQLEKCLIILNSEKDGISDINEVYDSLPEALKPFVKPLSLSDDDYATQWQEGNLVVKRKRIHAEDDYHKFKTIRGDYVGSKSEAIIADRLFVNNIPYHYEVAFTPEAEPDSSRPVFDAYGRLVGFDAIGFNPTDRDTLHPDFYVLNKRTRKAYFWEHLGRLSDPKYCTDNLNRMVRIIDAGYTIGEEILITHEDSYNPLRLESIDEIIDKYLK
ncbi:MAG: hypothetical protein J6U27_01590 [Spirochaetales bacterium]|nr:hypothetical protein [Spirochaetales bacterium]